MLFPKCRDAAINQWPGLSRGTGKVIINPNLPQLWTPKNNTPAIWLSANGASNFTLQTGQKISQWNDISGNSRHFTQASSALQPVFNSTGFASAMPCVQNTASTYMLGPASASIFPSGIFIIAVIQKTGANNTRECAPIQMSFGGNVLGIEYYNTTILTGNRSTTFSTTSASDVRTMTSGSIIEYGVGASSIVQFLNGTSVINSTATSGYAPGALGLCYDQGGTFKFTGNIMEVIMYAAIPTATIRQKLEGYLAWFWNITSALPSNHPYKNTPPLV